MAHLAGRTEHEVREELRAKGVDVQDEDDVDEIDGEALEQHEAAQRAAAAAAEAARVANARSSEALHIAKELANSLSIGCFRVVPRPRTKIKDFMAAMEAPMDRWAADGKIASVKRGVFEGQAFVEVVPKFTKNAKEFATKVKADLPEKAVLIPPYDPSTNEVKQAARIGMFSILDCYEESCGSKLQARLSATRPIPEMKNPTWSYEDETGQTIVRGIMQRNSYRAVVHFRKGATLQGKPLSYEVFKRTITLKWNSVYALEVQEVDAPKKGILLDDFKRNRRDYI